MNSILSEARQVVGRAILNGSGISLPQLVVEQVNMLRVPFKGRMECLDRKEAEALRNALSVALCEKAINLEVSEIKMAVCEEYSISIAEMDSGKRPEHIAFPRQVAYWLTRTLTSLSLAEIGRCFPKHHTPRDHGTILHGYKTVERKMGEDKQIWKRITKLQNRLMKEGTQTQ